MHYGSVEEEIIKLTPRDQIMALNIDTSPPAERPEDLLKLSKQFIGMRAQLSRGTQPFTRYFFGRIYIIFQNKAPNILYYNPTYSSKRGELQWPPKD